MTEVFLFGLVIVFAMVSLILLYRCGQEKILNKEYEKEMLRLRKALKNVRDEQDQIISGYEFELKKYR